MKKLLLITAFLFSINSQAQTTCPTDPSVRWHATCPTEPSVRWHDCVGTLTWPNGDQYVGAFQDGNMHGQGTYTFANGNTDKGYYMNGDFIPDICKGMWLAERTEAFGNCVVKLIDKL